MEKTICYVCGDDCESVRNGVCYGCRGQSKQCDMCGVPYHVDELFTKTCEECLLAIEEERRAQEEEDEEYMSMMVHRF